jgi:uncharacterized protein (TIGR03067 family)
MRMVALLLCAFGSLAFAPAPFPRPDPGKAQLQQLQGTWVRVQNGAGGAARTRAADFTVRIDGDRMKYSQDGENVVFEYAITLNARKKPPVFDSRGVGGMARGHVYRGVYRLCGDTLLLCSRLGEAEGGRPATFDATGPGVIVEVFHRQNR